MPEKLDTEIRTQGAFEQGGPTPLSQFATDTLGLRGPTTGELLQESGKITERRATRMEKTAESLEAQAKERATLAAEQAEARKTERPAPYEPPASPDLTARPFLSPPQSVLGQLQTALVGIAQVAQGVGGLKGKGYAIGATAALKGALEGWQAGDQERAQRAFEQWQVKTQTLLSAHRARRERYQDILDDQTRTMQDRLSQIGLDARISEIGDLGDAARTGEIDRVLTVLENQRAQELQLAVLMQRINKDYITHQDLQAHRAETEKRAKESGARQERKTKLYEETAGGLIKLQQQEVGLTQKLQNADIVADAVALLDKEGVLPPGVTVWDKAQAGVALQTKIGRRDIAWAVETLRRLGTPLLIGTEVALGAQGQIMRLKVVGEAEAGNVTGIPKSFWDQFIPNARKAFQGQRDIAREHLRALGRLPTPVEMSVSAGEWEE